VQRKLIYAVVAALILLGLVLFLRWGTATPPGERNIALSERELYLEARNRLAQGGLSPAEAQHALAIVEENGNREDYPLLVSLLRSPETLVRNRAITSSTPGISAKYLSVNDMRCGELWPCYT